MNIADVFSKMHSKYARGFLPDFQIQNQGKLIFLKLSREIIAEFEKVFCFRGSTKVK